MGQKSNKNLKLGKFLHFLPWKFSCLPLELILPHLNPPWNKSWWCPWFDNAIHTKRKHVTSKIGRKLIKNKNFSRHIYLFVLLYEGKYEGKLYDGLKGLALQRPSKLPIFQFSNSILKRNAQAPRRQFMNSGWSNFLEEFTIKIAFNCRM